VGCVAFFGCLREKTRISWRWRAERLETKMATTMAAWRGAEKDEKSCRIDEFCQNELVQLKCTPLDPPP
ncbi:hypothetical protein Bbelb_122800, partial [Branchiostoma belcheri]